MESSNSSRNCHICNKHSQSAHNGISHSVFGGIRAVQSPVIRMQSNHVVRSTPQGVVVVIVTKSNSYPETSDDKIVLDGKNDNKEWEKSWRISRSCNVSVHQRKSWVKIMLPKKNNRSRKSTKRNPCIDKNPYPNSCPLVPTAKNLYP